MEQRWEVTYTSCLVIFPSLWRVQMWEFRTGSATRTIDFLPGTFSSSLPRGPCGRPPYGSPLAPYGSISLKGALKNIKMLLYTFIAGPSHFPPSVFHMFMWLYKALVHDRPFIMRVASLTKIKNWNSPLSVTRDLNYFKYVILSIQTRTNS